MKKVFKNIIFAMVAIISVFSLVFVFPIKTNSANASTVATLTANSFGATASSILREYVAFKNRTPGSEDEKKAYEYIVNYLNNNTAFSPLENNYISAGVQTFRFDSTLDGKTYTSQNIIYELKSSTKTDKKIIIGCSYDAVAYKVSDLEVSVVESESVNGGAGSVATLLALAKNLSVEKLEYNVEIVFFGAGASDNAGSRFYTQGISEETASNILLMINLDKITIGKNLYFYVDEIQTEFSKFVSKLSKNGEINIKGLSVSNLCKTTSSDPIGLGYSHICLTSNNVNFMNSNVLTMNLIAGDYSSGINLGLSEYDGQEPITYTENDNLDYIKENYGESVISDNLQNVYNVIVKILTNDEFVSVCEKSRNQTSWLYNIFTNDKLVVYLTCVSIIVLLSISFIVVYKLTKRSYYANIEKDFVNSVMSISSNMSNNRMFEKVDVPDIVTDVLVDDIKNDKRIRSKKNKKGDDKE